MRLSSSLLSGLFFTLLMFLAPSLLGNAYYVSILILGSLNALVVVGLNLLLGFAGQISLGHAAFFGLAAYTTAILSTTWHQPLLLSMPAGVALSTLVAYLIGIPTLKLRGHYLAMATLGFGVIVSIVFNETIALTGGPSGFVGIPRLALFGYSFESDLSYYYLMAAVLCLAVFLSFNLINSKTGRALRAIHVSEAAASSTGIDIARYKLFIFVLSAAFAGLSGVLYAHYLSFIAPSSFGFNYSVQLITMVVLGGMSSLWGAVAGAFFLTALPEFLRVFQEIDIIIYGLLLILCMIYLPGGLAGGASLLYKFLRRKVRGNA